LLIDPVYLVSNFWIKVAWGINLPRATTVGPGLFICHFGGITISPMAVIGQDCNFSHDITIGVAGHGDACGVPSLGDNVYVGPGAKLIGPIRIGSNVKIGANAVIYKDVPDDTVVAAPTFEIVSSRGNRRPAMKLVA
jgi:serine O-acetyltransferase